MVTALWSQQSRSCWHTVLSVGAGAKHRVNTNLLFHLSAERKHAILKMLCRQSVFSASCLFGGKSLSTAAAFNRLSRSTSLIWVANNPWCCSKGSGTTLDCSLGPWRLATKAQVGTFEACLLMGSISMAPYPICVICYKALQNYLRFLFCIKLPQDRIYSQGNIKNWAQQGKNTKYMQHSTKYNVKKMKENLPESFDWGEFWAEG